MKNGVLVLDGQQEYPRSILRHPAASDGGIQWRLAEMKRGFVLTGQTIAKRTVSLCPQSRKLGECTTQVGYRIVFDNYWCIGDCQYVKEPAIIILIFYTRYMPS